MMKKNKSCARLLSQQERAQERVENSQNAFGLEIIQLLSDRRLGVTFYLLGQSLLVTSESPARHGGGGHLEAISYQRRDSPNWTLFGSTRHLLEELVDRSKFRQMSRRRALSFGANRAEGNWTFEDEDFGGVELRRLQFPPMIKNRVEKYHDFWHRDFTSLRFYDFIILRFYDFMLLKPKEHSGMRDSGVQNVTDYNPPPKDENNGGKSRFLAQRF